MNPEKDGSKHTFFHDTYALKFSYIDAIGYILAQRKRAIFLAGVDACKQNCGKIAFGMA